MELSFEKMERTLMEELRLYHRPVAVTFLFSDEEIAAFKRAARPLVPVKPLTFCQWELGARMQGKVILGTPEKLGCSNAKVSFGWKGIDDNEIRSQLKYCTDFEQAKRFFEAKPTLPLGKVKAIAVAPLGKALQTPHVVHFFCDSLQAYHLAVDYMAATDTHPLKTQLLMSSSCCGGSVWSWQNSSFNFTPPCSGSYNAGKTERGESNVFIPGKSIKAVVERLLERIQKSGSASITRPGDNFPGGDICKNCPLIHFKEEDGACKNCPKS